MTKKNKKTFTDDIAGAFNPAMQFISQPQQATSNKPKRTIERKTRRVQLLLKPSLYNKLKEKAELETGGSVNEAINQILEDIFEV